MKKFILASLSVIVLSVTYKASAQVVIPCSTTEYTNEFLANDPEYIQNQAILEQAIREYIRNKEEGKIAETGDIKIIPIVFHVIHNYGTENIPRQRIIEQVDILNRDFRRLNSDTNETNPIYKNLGADTKIEFRLAQIDPNGNCTDGIVRVHSTLTYDAGNDVKALSYWPNNKYFNVWVVQTITGAAAGSVVLGRSQFPGGSNLTDGVLMRSEVIGNTTAFNNHGRTLVHEIGHSLNLRHIWGDATCGNDQVDDTPVHTGANSGCPTNKQSVCSGNSSVDMDENYMDYTDGDCQNMFSLGQNDRMQAVLNGATNGRNNLWTQANLEATGTDSAYVPVLCSPKADFYAPSSACQNTAVAIKDFSWNGQPSKWYWTFEGASKSTDTVQNPVVVFDSAGTFSIKLKVTNAAGADSVIKDNYITILPDSSTIYGPYADGIESATFPDNGWRLMNSDDGRVWERTIAASYTGSASFYIKNHTGNPSGKIDGFISPAINLSNATAASLKFRLAHAQRTSSSADKLTVSVSKNCGQSYILKYNKSGNSLQTAGIKATNYVPANSSEWVEQTVALTNILGTPNGIIKFESTSDAGNNIYIDDIQITGTFTSVDEFIANNIQFEAVPNPFSGSTALTFFLPWNAKVNLSVYDLIGRRIGTIAESEMGFGEHETILDADAIGLSNGIYFIRLKVNDQVFTKKIILNN